MAIIWCLRCLSVLAAWPLLFKVGYNTRAAQGANTTSHNLTSSISILSENLAHIAYYIAYVLPFHVEDQALSIGDREAHIVRA